MKGFKDLARYAVVGGLALGLVACGGTSQQELGEDYTYVNDISGFEPDPVSHVVECQDVTVPPVPLAGNRHQVNVEELIIGPRRKERHHLRRVAALTGVHQRHLGMADNPFAEKSVN